MAKRMGIPAQSPVTLSICQMLLAHLSRGPPPRARPVRAEKDGLGVREPAADWAGTCVWEAFADRQTRL